MIPRKETPKQVLIISATERELNTILTTLSSQQRADVLLTATKIIRNMFIDTARYN